MFEKEAEEYADTVKCEWENDTYWVDCRDKVTDAYLAGAEPREKQIQIDAEQIRALQKQNGELTDELKALMESVKNYGAGCYENGLRNGKRAAEKVKIVEHFEAYGQCRDSRRIAELEAQIEKMKRCEICKHYQGESCNYHSNWVKDCKENGMKLFELKEIKEK